MIVLDANIVIRAVLGKRVRQILETHFSNAMFFAPDTAFAEAKEHLPDILVRRGIDPESALTVLNELPSIIGFVDAEIYGPTGVATWTTDRVELLLSEAIRNPDEPEA
ncbi:MAG: hypothetical protein H7Y20_18665 [Bryobacteraceae bacterium]|nr:hypothetical protein [Bryobacteraceae bacterium]